MYNINPYIRVTQELVNGRKRRFLYNSMDGLECDINKSCYDVISDINSHSINSHEGLLTYLSKSFTDKIKAYELCEFLFDNNIVITSEKKF